MSEFNCAKCGKAVPYERYELLKVKTCVNCTPQPEIFGVMEYQSKNLPELVICTSREELKQLQKPANRRR
jgi:hypothetical protein